MKYDYLTLYYEVGGDYQKILHHILKGRISELTIDQTKMKYPLSKQRIAQIKNAGVKHKVRIIVIE